MRNEVNGFREFHLKGPFLYIFDPATMIPISWYCQLIHAIRLPFFAIQSLSAQYFVGFRVWSSPEFRFPPTSVIMIIPSVSKSIYFLPLIRFPTSTRLDSITITEHEKTKTPAFL
jgi:hypothetical protein